MANWYPFIADQQWSLLTEFENPLPYLAARYFSSSRRGFELPGIAEAEPDKWRPVDRLDVLTNSLHYSDLGAVDIRRFVIVTDAGLGKTCSMEWIAAGLSTDLVERHPEVPAAPIKTSQAPRTVAAESTPATRSTTSQAWLAYNVPREVLSEGTTGEVHNRLRTYLRQQIITAAEASPVLRKSNRTCSPDQAEQIVQRALRAGRLMLLFDGLDHLNSVEALKQILQSGVWAEAHIGLAGRPSSVRNHYHRLFRDPGWRFLRMEELETEQQKKYLGSRYDDVPTEARNNRNIMGVPRVIQYLRDLPESEMKRVRTAADVFYGAIRTMVIGALDGSTKGREMAWSSNHVPETADDTAIEATMHLLGVIAFEMVANKVPVPIQDEAGEVVGANQRPNFERVPEGKLIEFKDRVKARFPTEDFHRDWEALVAMSDGVLDTIFDDGARGLKGIEFRNKSLQEFLCAWYLGKHCGRVKPDLSNPGGSLVPENCNQFLWDWIYLPFEELSHDYQDIWGYLTQMRDDAIDPDIWLESIAPLYYPAREITDPETGKPRWIAKRSSEMIFRSWLRLQKHCKLAHRRALTIWNRWRSEFEDEILSGNRGDDLRKCATEFQDDLLTLPGGKFMMGSPPGSTGKLDGDDIHFFQQIIDGAPENLTELKDYITRKLQSARVTFPFGRTGEQWRAEWVSFLIRVCVAGGMALVEQELVGRDDEHWHEVSVKPFQLGRSPCLNSWYRMFDPVHGHQPVIQGDYQTYSLDDKQPVVFVQWFDAWAFCQWARWGDQSCQLPSEEMWEYAAKFGVDPEWEYWWEGEFDSQYCNAGGDFGTTTVPIPARANPKTKKLDSREDGLMDMLGNVNEWCSDIYEQRHSDVKKEESGDAESPRCLRGGSFDISAEYCRCAGREGYRPINADRSIGFRVARAQ